MRRRARARGDDPRCPAELTLNLKPFDAATGTTAASFYPKLDGYRNGETYSNLVNVSNGTLVRCASIQLTNATRILAIGLAIEATTPEGGPGPLDLATALEFEVHSYTLRGLFDRFPGERGGGPTALPVRAAFIWRAVMLVMGGRMPLLEEAQSFACLPGRRALACALGVVPANPSCPRARSLSTRAAAPDGPMRAAYPYDWATHFFDAITVEDLTTSSASGSNAPVVPSSATGNPTFKTRDEYEAARAARGRRGRLP